VGNLVGGSDKKAREIPGDTGAVELQTYPDGRNNPFAMRNFMKFVRKQWRRKTRKTGTIVSELCENCCLFDETLNAKMRHSPATIREYCLNIGEKYSSIFTEPPAHLLALVCFVLYTQQDVDSDRMFAFTDVPPFPVGQESPAARDEVYAPYRDQRQADKRNAMMFQIGNWGFRTSWEAFAKGSRHWEGIEAMRTWVKWMCLITATRRHYPQPRSVFRGLCGLPPFLVEEFRNLAPGSEIFWPQLSSTTTERSICESYANQAEPLEQNVIFSISGVSEGLELFRLSQYPKEAEFLLPCFSKLKVVTVHDTVPLMMECEYVECLMSDSFRQDVLDELKQFQVEMQNSKAYPDPTVGVSAEKLAMEDRPPLNMHDLPLQQYLDKYVVPTLLPGLTAVAEERPDNPEEWLAYYLLKNNPLKKGNASTDAAPPA
jgi:protein dpy-30